jgi:RNA 2',3'-cyclic 3'-phosphodiesterase
VTATRRLFVALPVPADVRAALVALQDELRGVLPPRAPRFTKAEQLHVTLRFYGDVAAERVPALAASLQAVGAAHAPIPLLCERIGVFASLRFPRVVWAWVHDDADALLSLERALPGDAPPKPFTGHVTLARLNGLRRPDAQRLADFAHGCVDRRFGAWTADAVHLVESDLRPGGAVHTVVERVPLVVPAPI